MARGRSIIGGKYSQVVSPRGRVYTNNWDHKVFGRSGRYHGTGLKYNGRIPLEAWYLDEATPPEQVLGATVSYAASYDLSSSPYFPITGDQGQNGSCATWSQIYYANGYKAAQANGWTGARTGTVSQLLNPTYVWHHLNGGDPDTGTFMDDAAIAMAQFGCPTQDLMPVSYSDVGSWGTLNAQYYALLHRSSSPVTVPGTTATIIQAIKGVLTAQGGSDGYPVTFALDADMLDGNPQASPAIPAMPSNDIMTAAHYFGYTPNNANAVFNHANTFVGWNDTIVSADSPSELGAFKCVNSWGKDYAVWWMTYQLAMDLFADNVLFPTYANYAVGSPTFVAKLSFGTPMQRNVYFAEDLVSPSGSVLSSLAPHYVANLNGVNATFPNPMLLDMSSLGAYSSYNSTDEFRFVLSQLASGALSGSIVGYEIEEFPQPYSNNVGTNYVVSQAATGLPLSKLGYVQAVMGSGTTVPTVLSAVISPPSIALGGTATITGTLETSGGVAINGETITFTVSNGDVIPATITNTAGSFSASYKPTKVGSVSIIASFGGGA